MASMLGRDAFKLAFPRDCSAEQIRDGLREKQPAFYYAKLPTGAVAQLRVLSQLGFYVVDVSVTLERQPSNDTEQVGKSSGLIRDYDAERHHDLARIAAECFVYSRFHLDPQIDTGTANRIKRAWVENCMSGKRGDRLLVAEPQERAVGFLALMNIRDNGQSVQVIDLIGVERDSQGRGIGRALVTYAVQHAGPTADVIRVGTQAANVPSLRLYENSGFRVVGTHYVLHAHL